MRLLNTSSKSMAARLLRLHDLPGRARLIAQQVSESLPEGSVFLYVNEAPEGAWKLVASVGETRLPPGLVLSETGRFAELEKAREPLLLADEQLAPEDYAHLQLKQKPQCWAGLPILSDRELVGALEIVCFDHIISPATLLSLTESLEDAGPALSHPFKYEQERTHYLEAISRVHELYELEKIFNSTMEMETLFHLVPSKFRDVLKVRAVNLWMVKDEEKLMLVGRAGKDPTLPVFTVQRTGEGLVSQVSDSGESRLINDGADPYLRQRNATAAEGKIASLMAGPLLARSPGSAIFS